MVKLSECKFGDRLRTEDGEMVVFLGTEDYHGLDGVLHNIYYCAMAVGEHFVIMEYYDGERGNNDALPEIVSRWEDEIENPATPLRNKARYAESDKANKGCKRSNGRTMVARHQTSNMS